jgi:hypothetical protein
MTFAFVQFDSSPGAAPCPKGVRDVKGFLKGIVGRLWAVIEILDN